MLLPLFQNQTWRECSMRVIHRLSLSAVAYVIANPLPNLRWRNTLSVTPGLCGLHSFTTDPLVALLDWIFILFTEECLRRVCEYIKNLHWAVVCYSCSSLVLKSAHIGVSSQYLDASLTAVYWSSRETAQLTLIVQLTLCIMIVSFAAFTSTTTCNLRKYVTDSRYCLLDTDQIYYRLFIFVKANVITKLEERFYSSKSDLLQFLPWSGKRHLCIAWTVEASRIFLKWILIEESLRINMISDVIMGYVRLYQIYSISLHFEPSFTCLWSSSLPVMA